MASWFDKLLEQIKNLFQGFKVYFGVEFRFYSITFFFFLAVIGVLAPVFILLKIQKFGNIEMVYLIGWSSAMIYLLYTFLNLNGRFRKVFFQTKWKYILAIVVPVSGTIGVIFLTVFLFQFNGVAKIFYSIITYGLLIAFLTWLVIQLITIALFLKDLNVYFLDQFETNKEKKNRNLIIFSLLFQSCLIIYFFSVKPTLDEISQKIGVHFMWIFPLVVIIITSTVLLITLIRKNYPLAFFSTNYILFYNLYLLYHLIYLVIYFQVETGIFVKFMNYISIAIFIFTVIYALQSAAGVFKSRMEGWQPISFSLFTNALLYVTWSITFLYNLGEKGAGSVDNLVNLFWSINHLLSYVFGIFLVIISVFIFMPRLKKKKE